MRECVIARLGDWGGRRGAVTLVFWGLWGGGEGGRMWRRLG